MTTVLVDSNILLDVMTEDPRWYASSATTRERVTDDSRLVINLVVYAEVSVRFSRIEELETALPKSLLAREAIP